MTAQAQQSVSPIALLLLACPLGLAAAGLLECAQFIPLYTDQLLHTDDVLLYIALNVASACLAGLLLGLALLFALALVVALCKGAHAARRTQWAVLGAWLVLLGFLLWSAQAAHASEPVRAVAFAVWLAGLGAWFRFFLAIHRLQRTDLLFLAAAPLGLGALGAGCFLLLKPILFKYPSYYAIAAPALAALPLGNLLLLLATLPQHESRARDWRERCLCVRNYMIFAPSFQAGGHALATLAWTALLLGASVANYRYDWIIESLREGHRCLALICAMAGVATALPLCRAWLARLTQRATLGLFAALLGISAVAQFAYECSLHVEYLLSVRSEQAGFVTTLVRKATDVDRDGYSWWLGGGDRNSWQKAVNLAPPETAANAQFESTFALSAIDRGRIQNILLITVDTLRADHMGVYGYDAPTTPNLDAFAQRAVVFEQCYSYGSATFASLPAMLTGRCDKRRREKSAFTPFPVALADRGWAAAALPAIPFTAQFVSRNAETSAQYRELFDENAGQLTDHALRWIEAQQGGFFLWVHYVSPHAPYVAHPEFENFGDADIDRYDQEIARDDKHIGRLLDTLAAAGRLDSTAVILTADHGEEFGEHHYRFHDRYLYNTLIHVPLIVYAPGCAPSRQSMPVSTLDIAPTALDLAGIDAPHAMHGRSLAPGLFDPAHGAPDRPVVSAIAPDIAAVIAGGAKLVYYRNYHAFELFDLQTDPRERTNLADWRDSRMRSLYALLYQWMKDGEASYFSR